MCAVLRVRNHCFAPLVLLHESLPSGLMRRRADARVGDDEEPEFGARQAHVQPALVRHETQGRATAGGNRVEKDDGELLGLRGVRRQHLDLAALDAKWLQEDLQKTNLALIGGQDPNLVGVEELALDDVLDVPLDRTCVHRVRPSSSPAAPRPGRRDADKDGMTLGMVLSTREDHPKHPLELEIARARPVQRVVTAELAIVKELRREGRDAGMHAVLNVEQ